jgi:methenyltetrahydromethanopterin cyclohydrolase
MKSFSEGNALDKVISVNRLARRILEKLLSNPDLYGIKVEETAAGTTLIDAGIEAKGGFEAGRLITEICMGGCGKAEITSRRYGDF